MNDMKLNDVSSGIIGACIEVHKLLGPGLLESVYLECVCREMELRGIRFSREVAIPIIYKDLRIDTILRADLIVEDQIIVELKAVKEIIPVFEAQLLTYLKLANKRLGLLINFNVPLLKNGIMRMLNSHLPTSET